MKRFRIDFRCTLALAVACLLCTGCPKSSDSGASSSKSLVEERREQTNRIETLIESEDLVLDLTPRLGKFAGWFQADSNGEDASFPEDLFECKSTLGLLQVDPSTVFHADASKPEFVEAGYWPVAEKPDSGNNPWAALNSLNAQWETVKFGVVSSEFLDNDRTRFRMHTKSEGRGKSSDMLYGLKGQQDVTFRLEGSNWVLDEWKQLDLKIIRSKRAPFEESLASALPDEESLERATRSYMDEIILATSESGKFELPDAKYEPWTTMTADHVFPSVAVVDYNGDDLDDLFLTARWGPTQLLENQGDGTFKEVTRDAGLYFEYLVNCALFVDLDNDGDPDALIGRPMEPAKYFRNDDGVYVDVTEELSDLVEMPQYFVSAIAASDVNRDGLLDVYLSTYPPLAKQDTGFEHQFLNEFERKKYLQLREENDRWVDTPGTANILLMNRGGGRLERVPYDEAISQWRRSYQAVWGDLDNDGDDDLYICNDFAPDAVLRNDTPRGAEQPVMVDISDQLFTADGIGFGMGASYGDYDRDGDLDLYVSNMFSKAGNRIFQKLDSVDPRIRGAAAGCFLYQNDGGKLNQLAGSGDGKLSVNQVGWSYGGQWVDLDNNGQLDLYVPTGFYTAPNEIATQVDL